MRTRIMLQWGWVAAVLFLAGCAGTQQAPVSTTGPVETPHYLCGSAMQLLENDQPEQAAKRFQKALKLEPDYGPALIGLARVESELGNPAQAGEWAGKALQAARNDQDRVEARMVLLELSFQERREEWLQAMEKQWKAIRRMAPEAGEATLLMGRGYQAAGRTLKAAVCYRQVMDWNKDTAGEADRLLQKLYQQLRAAPGIEAGMDIAALDRITRSELAVLLVQALKLPEYLEAKAPDQHSASFRTPQAYAASDASSNPPAANDVQDHPFAADIQVVLKYQLRGLRCYPDGSFHPQEQMSRAGFALVAEDILARVTQDPGLKTAFVGNSSPFPDVSRDHFAFNAILVTSTRDFLAADLDGVFRPNDPVTGAEGLLAVKRLREEIKSAQITY